MSKICKECPAPRELRMDGTLSTRCVNCGRKRNEAARNQRTHAKANGLCCWDGSVCLNKPVDGHQFCEAHIARSRRKPPPCPS